MREYRDTIVMGGTNITNSNLEVACYKDFEIGYTVWAVVNPKSTFPLTAPGEFILKDRRIKIKLDKNGDIRSKIQLR
jgi:hypothetical protein